MQDKYTQLAQAKRLALGCLIFAASVFMITTATPKFIPELANAWWLGLIKMASEAALVGGLADWFAVTALFKPIPAKYPIPHTNIVANNKSVIANNLSLFVKEKFFHPEAIEKLISSSDPAKGAGRWLVVDANATRLSRFICDALAGVLRVLDDEPVKAFIARTAEKGIKQLDLRQLMATSLNAVTRERQHQVVLDRVLGKLANLMAQPDTQVYIADTLVVWLKTEYSRLEKILPSSWLSEQGALIAVKAVSSILEDIYHDEEHPIRHAFDEQVHEFLYELQHSPLMEKKVNGYREKIVNDPALKNYVHQSWGRFHTWLLATLDEKEGKAETKVASLLKDIGTNLTSDSELSRAFNKHIGEAAKYMAPELAEFLTRHIRDTINSWDEREMAQQVELNIGRDLQKVRINGTIVGGLIGAILFGIETLVGL
ncbi:membrane protein [Alteromonas sp. KC3]|uniref:DUF445 domain-containing protein n=1 Tax=unclassified Alteromonas TaxID=2614992 RepID=UPI001923D4A0|nr:MULTISPECIES: DUF445 domain-containing protein [unclassified Alteromonas]BCO18531.1 membrane protein [Alteromonas sp. KC3]BCO22492.1 membrane protein [Alteromonas sp. KC14]